MDTESRQIKVKRVYPKPHLRSLSENESGLLSESNIPWRQRRSVDAMFSLVQVKTDNNEARKDKDSFVRRNKNKKSSQRPISSPCRVLDDSYENETESENIVMTDTKERCPLRRSRSGSGSLIFSSLKQDYEFCNAPGYPINLSSDSYVEETPQRYNDDKDIDQEIYRRSRAVSFSNQSILHSAISRDDVEELSGLIDSEDPDLNLPDEVGITMLHRAAIDGSYRCLNFLLSRGAQVDATDHEGWTPLHDAVFHGHVRCAVFLLTSGADAEAETKDFLKPIEMADDEEMILVVGRAMALKTAGQNSNYDKETLV